MRRGPLAYVPKWGWAILREMARHALRHPVVGIAIIARDDQGRLLLIRRSDTGEWALPGGTLEWGETLATAASRELEEETGARLMNIQRLVGVFSRPDRDSRFHGVTVVVTAEVDSSRLGPHNPLEVREARLFDSAALPGELAFGAEDFLRIADGGGEAVLE